MWFFKKTFSQPLYFDKSQFGEVFLMSMHPGCTIQWILTEELQHYGFIYLLLYSREIKAVPTGNGSSQLCLRWTHPGENLCTCLHSGSSLYSGWPRSAPPKSQASSSTSSLPSRWLNSGLHSRRGVGTARLHNQKVSVTQSLFHLASGSCFNPHPALI